MVCIEQPSSVPKMDSKVILPSNLSRAPNASGFQIKKNNLLIKKTQTSLHCIKNDSRIVTMTDRVEGQHIYSAAFWKSLNAKNSPQNLQHNPNAHINLNYWCLKETFDPIQSVV